jgi:hypothetical protein
VGWLLVSLDNVDASIVDSDKVGHDESKEWLRVNK